MKRLALALAAAALGTGCYVAPSTPGSVDVGWSFVRTKITYPSGVPTPVQVTPAYTCATVDVHGSYLVSDVLVSFDGNGSQAVPCNDGAGDGARFEGLTPGQHTLTVSARQLIGGVPVATFTAQTTVTVGSGQVTSVSLPLYGIPGNLEVWGGFYSADGMTPFACISGDTGAFSIADSVGTIVATGTATCAAGPAGTGWRLGVGFSGSIALDLDVYAIRMTALGQYDSASPANSCGGQAFQHTGANDTGTAAWFPTLYNVAGVPIGNLCP
jgi:hypothetical protein